MSFNWNGLATTFGQAVSTLTAAGLTPTAAASAVSSIFGNELSTIQPNLTAIMGNYTDAALIKDECTKIKETSGWPPAASPLLDSIEASAGNLPAIVSLIQAIKTELQG